MIVDRLRSWSSTLLEPVDAASTAVFRIVLGLVLAWDAARYMGYRWIDEYYILPKVHFTYLFFEFVQPWPGQWMYVHFAALGFLALLFAAGLFYRVAAPLLFLAYTYVFLLEESVYMNHYYLIILLLFVFIFAPAERAYSLDRLRAPASPPVVPRWTVSVVRFQLFVVYFYGAIAKLNPDWLAGEPMYSELVRRGPDVPPIATHLPPAFLAYAIAYGGILIDAAVPILLCLRRTRVIGFVVAVVFHVLNEVFLNIGLFSYLMFGALTIFFEPDWPRRLGARLGRGSATAQVGEAPHKPRLGPAQIALIAGLHVYVLVQLFFPLRHWLYPGPVSWTEEGHRFAWQMKLRKKDSIMTIHVRDPATGREWTVDPAAELRPRQMKKLHTFPDMVLQYVHHLRDQLRAEGIRDPVITVDWMCSLNGAPHERLVDPTVDLAAVERSWRPAKWILANPAGAAQSSEAPRHPHSSAQSTGLLSKGASASTSSP